MIEVSGELKTPQEIRQRLYENIIDEAMYIARGADGSISLDWVMNQPVFIRKKYFQEMKDEVAERKKLLEDRHKSK